MLKPWTPASARGTSTAQRERDAPGKKMQALGVLGCTRRQEMPLALRGQGTQDYGGLRARGPRSTVLPAPVTPLDNDVSVPCSCWGAETRASLSHLSHHVPPALPAGHRTNWCKLGEPF